MRACTAGGGVGYATRQAYDMFWPTVLFFVLGFAPFGIINGMWSQLAVMRNFAPEGRGIGTTVGSIYNVANVFPFIYVLAESLRSQCSERVVIPDHHLLRHRRRVCARVLLASAGRDLSAQQRSIVIYVCSFLAGGVGCMLGVILYSYIGRFATVCHDGL
jgi:hypothetical protein